MQPTLDDLQQAFNRTQLRRLNVSFDEAMAIPAIAICLNRIASIAIQKSKAALPATRNTNPAKNYWYNNI